MGLVGRILIVKANTSMCGFYERFHCVQCLAYPGLECVNPFEIM